MGWLHVTFFHSNFAATRLIFLSFEGAMIFEDGCWAETRVQTNFKRNNSQQFHQSLANVKAIFVNNFAASGKVKVHIISYLGFCRHRFNLRNKLKEYLRLYWFLFLI